MSRPSHTDEVLIEDLVKTIKGRIIAVLGNAIGFTVAHVIRMVNDFSVLSSNMAQPARG